MTFEHVPTERGPSQIAGSDFNNPVRVMMRSPKAALVVGYGVHLIVRRGKDFSYDRSVGATRLKAFSEKAVERIDAIFGEGAAAEAIKARSRGTVLVDGGGDPLPLPERVIRESIEAEYAKATPTRDIPMEGVKGCQQCGKPLMMATVAHHLDPSPKPGHPKTVEDCYQFTNLPIVAVHGFAMSRRDLWEYIDWFYTWDGESYVDDYFCSDRCAAHYGRRAARAFEPLPADGTVIYRNARSHESVNHYEREERTITMADGTKFKI